MVMNYQKMGLVKAIYINYMMMRYAGIAILQQARHIQLHRPMRRKIGNTY